MRRVIEYLCVAVIVAVFCMAGYLVTTEFLDLRQRVEQIEKQLEKPIELEIIVPDIVIPFGEPTPAPPLVPIPDENLKYIRRTI
jgi:hypothetical protein